MIKFSPDEIEAIIFAIEFTMEDHEITGSDFIEESDLKDVLLKLERKRSK